jgi:hypothetical protein
VFHGFLRTPDGAITTFDVPGAGIGPGQGTRAGNINPPGAIAGRYIDASDVSHGFLRVPDGTITTFDAPNAGTGPGQGTIVFAVDCLNPAGAIAATSLDASNVYHVVLRAPDGTMTTFDAPGAGTRPFQGTLTFGINSSPWYDSTCWNVENHSRAVLGNNRRQSQQSRLELGCSSETDSTARVIYTADAYSRDGRRFTVLADERLSVFLELERIIGAASGDG